MMQEVIKRLLQDSIDVKLGVKEHLVFKIEEAAKKVVESYKKGGKVILFGNGGSAADAQHIQAELTHQFEIKGRKSLPALALTTNTSVLTAIGNDDDFRQIFEKQVEGLVDKKDVVIGISTSGNAENVIRGVEQAKKKGASTIALTGRGGGKLKDIADLSLIVPSDNTARIQEAHITIAHIICHLIERELIK